MTTDPEFNWQAAFHKEHADLCHLEANNHVLEQRIKALEAKQREIQLECEEWPCGDNDPLVVSIFKIIARAG